MTHHSPHLHRIRKYASCHYYYRAQSQLHEELPIANFVRMKKKKQIHLIERKRKPKKKIQCKTKLKIASTLVSTSFNCVLLKLIRWWMCASMKNAFRYSDICCGRLTNRPHRMFLHLFLHGTESSSATAAGPDATARIIDHKAKSRSVRSHSHSFFLCWRILPLIELCSLAIRSWNMIYIPLHHDPVK